VSEKSTRKDLDYAVKSTAARNRPVFRPRMQRGSCKTLRALQSKRISAEKGDSGLYLRPRLYHKTGTCLPDSREMPGCRRPALGQLLQYDSSLGY